MYLNIIILEMYKCKKLHLKSFTFHYDPIIHSIKFIVSCIPSFKNLCEKIM